MKLTLGKFRGVKWGYFLKPVITAVDAVILVANILFTQIEITICYMAVAIVVVGG